MVTLVGFCLSYCLELNRTSILQNNSNKVIIKIKNESKIKILN